MRQEHAGEIPAGSSLATPTKDADRDAWEGETDTVLQTLGSVLVKDFRRSPNTQLRVCNTQFVRGLVRVPYAYGYIAYYEYRIRLHDGGRL